MKFASRERLRSSILGGHGFHSGVWIFFVSSIPYILTGLPSYSRYTIYYSFNEDYVFRWKRKKLETNRSEGLRTESSTRGNPRSFPHSRAISAAPPRLISHARPPRVSLTSPFQIATRNATIRYAIRRTIDNDIRSLPSNSAMVQAAPRRDACSTNRVFSGEASAIYGLPRFRSWKLGNNTVGNGVPKPVGKTVCCCVERTVGW